MDLVARGWSLHNYAERLSHSATPEFGSLALLVDGVAGSKGHWPVLGFAAFTGGAVLIGSVVFVGTRTALEDVLAARTSRRPVRARS